MKAHIPLFLFSILLLIFFLSTLPPFGRAHAAPDLQGFITATPGPDGRILYAVVDGDNCGQVALLHGITIQQLRQFNPRLDQDCSLSVGQQLVVGLAQADAPTAGSATAEPSPTVTPTPVSGTTEVCVLLFDDVNGDAMRQETEFGIDGGAVSLTNLNGSYSETQDTSSAVDPDTLEPVRSCFIDVPGGEYNVSMAVPDAYNPTMLVSYTLTVQAGDRASVDFGAQSKTITVSETTDPAEGSRSSILGIFGFLLLLGGVGLGYYAYRSGQPRNKLKGSPLTKK
jgi:hypothetical protein